MAESLIKNKVYFFIGITILVILILFYFVKVDIDSGGNYNTYDSLLGIVIFHNPFILAIYAIIVVKLITKGLFNR